MLEEGARLLAETRRALAERNAAHELVSAHSAAVERAADAHDRMTEVVLHGGDVSDVAGAVAEAAGRS